MPGKRLDDKRVWDKDRMEHAGRRRQFVTHTGTVLYAPDIRYAEGKKDWCRFGLSEMGVDDTHRWQKWWTVYAFSELARFACQSIRKGDRVMVYGLERGENVWVDRDGVKHKADDITAYDLGMSMLRNPAFAERNEPGGAARKSRRIEEGWPAQPDYSTLPVGPPPR